MKYSDNEMIARSQCRCCTVLEYATKKCRWWSWSCATCTTEHKYSTQTKFVFSVYIVL